MGLCKILSISSFLLATLTFFVHAATLNIQNHGGMRLEPRKSWSLNVNACTNTARIWGRTGCKFYGSGKGRCRTRDCGGRLQCQAYGTPPNTLVEYALNQFNNIDFFDISLIDGFNLPVAFKPTTPTSSTSNGCTLEIFDGVYEPLASNPTSSHECSTRKISCKADIVGQCPDTLKAPGGCNNPCTVFKIDAYCCNSGSCSATDYSKFFEDRCPDAYSYPKDDNTSTFTCPAGTNYEVIFCP